MKKLFLVLSIFIFGFLGCATEDTLSKAQSSAGLQVGVLVSPDDNTVTKVLVSKNQASMTALEALEASDAKLITLVDPLFGPAICEIDGVGQPEDNCFGDSLGRFWAFFIRTSDGTWKVADVGAGSYQVKDGDALAFIWTGSDADFNPIRKPPTVTLDDFAK